MEQGHRHPFVVAATFAALGLTFGLAGCAAEGEDAVLPVDAELDVTANESAPASSLAVGGKLPKIGVEACRRLGGRIATSEPALVRQCRKQGKDGPYCRRTCADDTALAIPCSPVACID